MNGEKYVDANGSTFLNCDSTEAAGTGAAEGARVRRDLPRRPTGDLIHHHVAGGDHDDDSGDGDDDGVKRATHPPISTRCEKGAFGRY